MPIEREMPLKFRYELGSNPIEAEIRKPRSDLARSEGHWYARGQETAPRSAFELHVARKESDGPVYEDTIENQIESERGVSDLVFGLPGDPAHEVSDKCPFMLRIPSKRSTATESRLVSNISVNLSTFPSWPCWKKTRRQCWNSTIESWKSAGS